jgi:hypothetical protein
VTFRKMATLLDQCQLKRLEQNAFSNKNCARRASSGVGINGFKNKDSTSFHLIRIVMDRVL